VGLLDWNELDLAWRIGERLAVPSLRIGNLYRPTILNDFDTWLSPARALLDDGLDLSILITTPRALHHLDAERCQERSKF